MKAMEEKILREGTVLPGGILQVGSFLNHQVDAGFVLEMGREIGRLFQEEGVTKVLTVETSGIPVAFSAAAALGVPMVFAKKNRTSNLSGNLFKTIIHSYTHGADYTVVVEKQYIQPEDRVLLADDFLANGKALLGLLDIAQQAGAKTVGAAVAIEKGFQRGGDLLRAGGLRVEALARIESMEGGRIIFCRT